MRNLYFKYSLFISSILIVFSNFFFISLAAKIMGIGDSSSKSRLNVALLVEPTPFNYVSGYSNRFKETLKYLDRYGDSVQILTPDDSNHPPSSFLSFPITSVHGFRLHFYKSISLTFDAKGETRKIIKNLKPNILHATTPGLIWLPAIYHSYRNR